MPEDRVLKELDLNGLVCCQCEVKFSIEPHGNNHVLYVGRCPHRHGENLFTISEISFNTDVERILNKLNS
jgi:hypothetical protein